MQTLHADSLRGLKQLKLLAMRHLSAEHEHFSLAFATSQHVGFLCRIDQGSNRLTELSAAVLRHLPLLEQLLLGGKISEDGTRSIVAGNHITELGAIFGHNEQLQVIDFSQNRLRKIDPATFAGLTKLR